MSKSRVARTPTRASGNAGQHDAEPSVNWVLTVPEIELFSTLYSHSLSARSFNKACRQLWAKDSREHVPYTLHYAAIPKDTPEQAFVRQNQPVTRQRLEQLMSGHSSAPIQVIWLEESRTGTGSPHSHESEVSATLRFMAENIGVSPLFLDSFFIPRATTPFNKLSEWPRYANDRRYSTVTADLTGMYRTLNENCVWFRHSFKDGQHRSSIYVVHTIRPQTTSTSSKFFTRLEHLRSSRGPRNPLLAFMAIDVLFSDTATAHSDLNSCYKDLRTALDSIDENVANDSTATRERIQKYYGTLKDSYKALNVLNTRCDDQFQTIGVLRDLITAWSLLDCDARVVTEREQRALSLHGTLDGMKMEMNILAGDIKARSQFFGTLMSLHLGALMQIDSSTSLSIASSSRKIAEETKKDGRSMKTIAVVTMAFLPASLIAGIIDTPFFTNGEESSGPLKMSQQFWLFWAISLPLTVLVFAAWLSIPYLSRLLQRVGGVREKSAAEKV